MKSHRGDALLVDQMDWVAFPREACGPTMETSLTPDELSVLFDELSDEQFVESQVLRPVPWILRARPEDYDGWRQVVAAAGGLPADAIWLVGSAATGFSLAPESLGRDFKDATDASPSDIDLAVVAESPFVAAWDTVLSFDRRRQFYRIGRSKARVIEDIYQGHLDIFSIPPDTGAHRDLILIANAASRLRLFRGHRATVWTYRRLDDLRDKQLSSVRRARATLAGGGLA